MRNKTMVLRIQTKSKFKEFENKCSRAQNVLKSEVQIFNNTNKQWMYLIETYHEN